jgi:hypothetical protein
MRDRDDEQSLIARNLAAYDEIISGAADRLLAELKAAGAIPEEPSGELLRRIAAAIASTLDR